MRAAHLSVGAAGPFTIPPHLISSVCLGVPVSTRVVPSFARLPPGSGNEASATQGIRANITQIVAFALTATERCSDGTAYSATS